LLNLIEEPLDQLAGVIKVEAEESIKGIIQLAQGLFGRNVKQRRLHLAVFDEGKAALEHKLGLEAPNQTATSGALSH
jgi:hypothetical protein